MIDQHKGINHKTQESRNRSDRIGNQMQNSKRETVEQISQGHKILREQGKQVGCNCESTKIRASSDRVENGGFKTQVGNGKGSFDGENSKKERTIEEDEERIRKELKEIEERRRRREERREERRRRREERRKEKKRIDEEIELINECLSRTEKILEKYSYKTHRTNSGNKRTGRTRRTRRRILSRFKSINPFKTCFPTRRSRNNSNFGYHELKEE